MWWMADEKVLSRMVEEGQDVFQVMGEFFFFCAGLELSGVFGLDFSSMS